MPEITSLNALAGRNKKRGRWKLDERHQLTYQSEGGKEQYELEASLVAAEADALIVSITQKQENGKIVTSLAKLSGTWRANEKNQFEFEVKGQSGKSDVLAFTGSWKVGEHNEIIYSCQTRTVRGQSRKSGSRRLMDQTLAFKGRWDLTEKNRLTYLVEGDSSSAFRFRGTFGSPALLAQKGVLHYQLGVEAESKIKGTRSKKRFQTITLFGQWRLSGKLELEFEIEYGGGEKSSLTFGAEYALTQDLTIAAKLISKNKEPLGLELILTKDFLKSHVQAFLRLKKTLAESAVEAGVVIPW